MSSVWKIQQKRPLSKILIDGDILVYRVGFTTNGVAEGVATWRMDSLVESICRECDSITYEIYLTSQDKSNYRFEIADDYKANRKADKPEHYSLLRTHLVKNHSAKVIYDMEADDALGIAQTEHTIIASIDKDLLQVPGKHYNFVKKVHREVTEFEGLKWFYFQCIRGDKADNIKGIPLFGPVKTELCLLGCQNEKELLAKTLALYKKTYPKEYLEKLTKAGQLLKIKQSQDEPLWLPPLELFDPD
jgi:5'-3' exonuclease